MANMTMLAELDLKHLVFLPSLKVALVVGTLLSVINQTAFCLNPCFDMAAMSRIGLNFLVPFCVSSYARYSFCKDTMLERTIETPA